ncbi:MAG: ATP synthase F1 subunit delta [Actinobacteria bacterium]|nr:ATP synthase F1 subunit delta [Actinomycetota bacterium]
MTTEATPGVLDDYALALFAAARGEDMLDLVEDQLFSVARAFEANDELRQKLSDQQIPVATREAIIEDLLGEGAAVITRALVSFIVAAGRASQLPGIVDAFVDAAAASRQHVVGEVRSAVALDEQQQRQLAQALSRATGKTVEVKVVIDPSVVGGVVAQVGDQVIDGSVRSRLQQLREGL